MYLYHDSDIYRMYFGGTDEWYEIPNSLAIITLIWDVRGFMAAEKMDILKSYILFLGGPYKKKFLSDMIFRISPAV